MPRREATFQGHLVSRLNLLVGMDGYVLNFDGNYIQGFPDILVLYKGRWAALECKRSADEPYQPNQEYYLQHLNELAWASVIHPGIEEEVINDLQQALRIR